MAIAPSVGHIFQSPEDAVVIPSGTGSQLRFLGIKRDLESGAEAYLERPAVERETDSHFHRVDQFQIMFGGGPGTYYQKHQLPKAFLLYTDAYSVYGPFGSGPGAQMSFLTLRAVASDLHGSMPKFRDQWLYRGNRHIQADLDDFIDEVALSKDEVSIKEIFPPESDGLAARVVLVGPGTKFVPPAGELRTGRYTVVLEGELNLDGRALGPKSVGWSSGETTEVELQAGADGAAVAFMHLPYPNTPSVRLASV